MRVGLNLKRGQRLLITDPYELQGIARNAAVIVEAVRVAATAAGCPHPAGIDTIWSDGSRLREFAAQADWRGFSQLVAANATVMQAAIAQGDALLFLPGSHPQLMAGIAAERVTELRRIAWEYFGPIAQQLIAGATNWTVAPAPAPEGVVRVSRPINYGGAVIDGIELEFRRGRVVKATAKTNAALLEQLLATDEGAARLGEVALVQHETSLARSGRHFHHALLDENASSHIALGEAYAFCLRSPNSAAQNRSLIHVDLPLDARVTLTKGEQV